MGERRPVHVGDPAELLTLQGGSYRTAWEPVTIVEVDEDYIVFETATGQRPAYGYGDEGRAWRRGTYVGCPLCKGTGQVLAPASEKT